MRICCVVPSTEPASWFESHSSSSQKCRWWIIEITFREKRGKAASSTIVHFREEERKLYQSNNFQFFISLARQYHFSWMNKIFIFYEFLQPHQDFSLFGVQRTFFTSQTRKCLSTKKKNRKREKISWNEEKYTLRLLFYFFFLLERFSSSFSDFSSGFDSNNETLARCRWRKKPQTETTAVEVEGIFSCEKKSINSIEFKIGNFSFPLYRNKKKLVIFFLS